MFPIKLVCQDVTHLAAIRTLVKAKFCLFVLRLNVPVNNFSVMSGQSQGGILLVCNHQELAQSKPNSRLRNLNGKQPKLQIDITKATYG